MRDITRDLRIGTCCGKCVPEAKLALNACLSHIKQTNTGFYPSGPEFAV
jgi:bacterioferritin-associated ferredoxin